MSKKLPDPYGFYPRHIVEEQAEKEDYYKILGLDEKREHATANDIKRAYHKLSLEYHPDKNPANEDLYKSISLAYQVLSNPDDRRSFDSSKYFDDTIPSVHIAITDQEFYDTFGKAFQANSKWSLIQPVPQLGNAETLLSDVQEFYKFWREFSSWRVFNYLDEFTSEDLADAEDREERRWMQRQNTNDRKRNKRKEVARIKELTETAYMWDPRINAYKEARRIEAERVESERVAAEEKARKQAESLRIETELREKKEAEQKKQSNREKQENKVRRKLMQFPQYADEDKIKNYIQGLTINHMIQVCRGLAAGDVRIVDKYDKQGVFGNKSVRK